MEEDREQKHKKEQLNAILFFIFFILVCVAGSRS